MGDHARRGRGSPVQALRSRATIAAGRRRRPRTTTAKAKKGSWFARALHLGGGEHRGHRSPSSPRERRPRGLVFGADGPAARAALDACVEEALCTSRLPRRRDRDGCRVLPPRSLATALRRHRTRRGLFRVPANAAAAAAATERLDNGEDAGAVIEAVFKECGDDTESAVDVVATLFKQWTRAHHDLLLPPASRAALRCARLARSRTHPRSPVASSPRGAAMVDASRAPFDPYADVLATNAVRRPAGDTDSSRNGVVVFEVLADVAAAQRENGMTPHNVAVVLAPNFVDAAVLAAPEELRAFIEDLAFLVRALVAARRPPSSGDRNGVDHDAGSFVNADDRRRGRRFARTGLDALGNEGTGPQQQPDSPRPSAAAAAALRTDDGGPPPHRRPRRPTADHRGAPARQRRVPHGATTPPEGGAPSSPPPCDRCGRRISSLERRVAHLEVENALLRERLRDLAAHFPDL